MLKKTVSTVAGHPVVLMDSITKANSDDAGAIVISASHGGASSGEFALEHPLACVVFNDAGVGKDRAGVAALDMLEARSIPGLTVSAFTARIGDAEDMWQHGIVSFVNSAARACGIEVGQKLAAAVDGFRQGRS